MKEKYTVFLVGGDFTDSDVPLIRLDGLTQEELQTVLEIVNRQAERKDLVIRKGAGCSNE